MTGRTRRVAVALVAFAVTWSAGPPAPAAAGRPTLYVMPLGDSITHGLGDPSCGPARTGCNGYRVRVQQYMRASGARFNMVGSRLAGTMWDRNNEGHIGWTTADILPRVDGWIRAARPNVVLLHLGTNDVRYGVPAQVSARNLAEIIRRVQGARRGDVHVFVARIIRTGLPVLNARIGRYNALVPGVVARAGPRVHLVDMSTYGGPRDRADGLHPNARGYAKMAYGWGRAMRFGLPRVARRWQSINFPMW